MFILATEMQTYNLNQKKYTVQTFYVLTFNNQTWSKKAKEHKEHPKEEDEKTSTSVNEGQEDINVFFWHSRISSSFALKHSDCE